MRQSNNDIKAKAFGSVLRFFERPSSRMSFTVDGDDDDDDDDDGQLPVGVLPWKYSVRFSSKIPFASNWT